AVGAAGAGRLRSQIHAVSAVRRLGSVKIDSRPLEFAGQVSPSGSDGNGSRKGLNADRHSEQRSRNRVDGYLLEADRGDLTRATRHTHFPLASEGLPDSKHVN